MSGPERPLLPSVLDRLIDLAPKVSTAAQGEGGHRLADLKQAVMRDLEWLLNTKQTIADMPPDMAQMNQSLLTFGLPDLTSTSLNNGRDLDRLRQVLGVAIARFEPRLIGVKVTLEEGRDAGRAVRFRIDAMLDVEPAPVPVTFDSVLQLTTKSFQVQGG